MLRFTITNIMKTMFYSLIFTVSCLASGVPGYDQLIANSKKFFKENRLIDLDRAGQGYFDSNHQFPNRIERVVGDNAARKKQVALWAQETKPLVSMSVLLFCKTFLKHKKSEGNGTEKEQLLYASMDVSEFVCRLYSQRPLVYFSKQESFVLRDGTSSYAAYDSDKGLFDKIGADDQLERATLEEYLSLDERCISSLCGIVSGSYCITNGQRNNAFNTDNAHLSQAYVAGLVGPCFEQPGKLEYKHMIVTKEQNTSENGYGDTPSEKDELLSMWAQFYGVSHFETFDRASNTCAQGSENCERFEPLMNTAGNVVGYLDVVVLRKRLELSIKPFLKHVNDVGRQNGKKMYVHVVGIGLGEWLAASGKKGQKVDHTYSSAHIQTQCMMQVYKKLIEEDMDVTSIAAINFSWFPEDFAEKHKFKSEKLDVIVSQRNPFDPLPDEYKDCEAYVMYAWDGYSFPGNEYLKGSLGGTSDPDTAVASLITELQNPEINPYLLPNVKKHVEQVLSIQDEPTHKINEKDSVEEPNSGTPKSATSSWGSFIRAHKWKFAGVGSAMVLGMIVCLLHKAALFNLR